MKTFSFAKSTVFAAALLALTAPAANALTDRDDAVDYLFKLGLMEGHLIVGKELLDARQPQAALPHFGHPVAELYDDLRPVLASEKIAPFDVELIALEAAVTKAPAAGATTELFNRLIARINAARGAVPAALRDSAPFAIEICANTIEAAAGEYGEAIEQGKIESLVEYHDSHGFIVYAQRELQRLSQSLSGVAAIRSMQALVGKASDIVGSLVPPEKPRGSVADYRAIADDAHKLITP